MTKYIDADRFEKHLKNCIVEIENKEKYKSILEPCKNCESTNIYIVLFIGEKICLLKR